MKTYINQLAEYILSNYKNSLTDIAVVFPSRRAGLLLKKEIGEMTDKPLWLPDVFTINDFIFKYTGCNIPNKLSLIIKLYFVYLEYEEQESFDKFYKWGEILLNDFGVIDKYLVKPELLFKRIKDINEIDERFPTELKEDFIAFWKMMIDRDTTDIKNDFLKVWQVISNVYNKFNKVLDEENIAYEGKVYRKVCNELVSGNLNIYNDYKKIIFAGFNNLSRAEEKIISLLAEKGIAEVIFDADKYYTESNLQEAGRFIRKNLIKFDGVNKSFIENELSKDNKTVNVISTPLQTGIVKALGAQLAELAKEDTFSEQNTAIVLPDESLLLPLLNSIPDKIKHINISMGFPLKYTPVYDLLLLLKDLQINKRFEKKKFLFYHSDVEKILLHPYIENLLGDESKNKLAEIRSKNLVYVDFTNSGLFYSDIFKNFEKASELSYYLKEVFSTIAENISSKNDIDNVYNKVQLEFIYSFFISLNTLDEILIKSNIEINELSYWTILIEAITNLHIPFTGEPFRGIQILGLLETRSLDYENVFVLSMNEGKFPKQSQNPSFIPYVLRKYFGLPVLEDDDSATAYYFHRLMQRAKNINLVYNSETDESYKGKSRFLMQIEYELVKANPNIILKEKVYTLPVNVTNPISIQKEKTNDVIAKLTVRKKYSPTRLIDYIQCPLKFYFKTVEEIIEPDEIEESFESNTFGTIFHDIMENLYKPYINQIITEEIIKNDLLNKVYNNYDKIFINAGCKENSKFEFSDPLLTPKNNIFKSILKELVIKTLFKDSEAAPFEIKFIEQFKNKNFSFETPASVKHNTILNGKIDRVELKDGITRIVDYKTGKQGKVTIKLEKADEELLTVFSNPNAKEKFQALFYAYLYFNNNADEKINAGMLYTKDAFSGINFTFPESIPNDVFISFEAKLKELFSDIFDTNKCFTQTEDVKNCNYCQYNSICYR